MFPSDWAHQTGQRRKRKAQDDQALSVVPAIASQPASADVDPEPEPAKEVEDLRLPSLILRSLNTASREPATPDELDLDVILSRVPYREILENLYGRDQSPTSDVPVVSRIYEESFMREPVKGERPCAAGELCECNFIDPCMPFTGVEFVAPGQDSLAGASFCVLCSRKVTQKLFYDILFTGKEAHGVIQRYGNICGVPGEFVMTSFVFYGNSFGSWHTRHLHGKSV